MSPRVSRLLQRRPLRRRVPPPLPLPLRPHLRLHSRRPPPLLQQLHQRPPPPPPPPQLPQRPPPHHKETRPPPTPASPPTAADLPPPAPPLRLHSRRPLPLLQQLHQRPRPLPLLQQLHQRPRPHSKETRPPQIPASPPTAADLWPLAPGL